MFRPFYTKTWFLTLKFRFLAGIFWWSSTYRKISIIESKKKGCLFFENIITNRKNADKNSSNWKLTKKRCMNWKYEMNIWNFVNQFWNFKKSKNKKFHVKIIRNSELFKTSKNRNFYMWKLYLSKENLKTKNFNGKFENWKFQKLVSKLEKLEISKLNLKIWKLTENASIGNIEVSVEIRN